MKIKNDKCEFYPEEGSVCYAGSDVAGPFKCTHEYSLVCTWANERRIKVEVFGRKVTRQIKLTREKVSGQ